MHNRMDKRAKPNRVSNRLSQPTTVKPWSSSLGRPSSGLGRVCRRRRMKAWAVSQAAARNRGKGSKYKSTIPTSMGRNMGHRGDRRD